MDFSTALVGGFILLSLALVANAQPLVPALIIFGDSTNDVGNNNKLYTIVKANFPPYGRDFNHTATGRFCNGKLAADFTSENIGFTSYPPAYLSPKANGKRLLTGANFASASSGYYDKTAAIYHVISLTKQLEYYKEYQRKVVSIVGKKNASSIFSGAVYILSAGSSDFIQNYYINPFLYKYYTPDQFSDILVHNFATFVQKLYKLGGRKVGVSSLPPLGCLPASITLFGKDTNECVKRLNIDAIHFNKKLNASAIALQKKLSGLNIVVFDIYTPLFDLIKKPSDSGFFESRKACCGTGTIETSFLCNKESPGTCANATGYVFWDSVHPTESANKLLSDSLLIQGISLLT
ncbi:GDSL esterase/lipase isoform X1 [Cinnamomum micranthum f. kanehirae]|uniref:GDSL esterase/lipase isoform X1 n=1 Tax=Cinnamomum micranthum f. kanehirae TaxID=337451 RepID=A0A443NSE7_9MAGN|nr:GDSL esterase/lipase isoform X1 [Cinnamomum micranthum f. kanehirae]